MRSGLSLRGESTAEDVDEVGALSLAEPSAVCRRDPQRGRREASLRGLVRRSLFDRSSLRAPRPDLRTNSQGLMCAQTFLCQGYTFQDTTG